MEDQKHPFAMFPSRIWNLPGITIQLLKFYEKIFQFWHQGNPCFLSNDALMEYAGMKSDSTLSDAFKYFEMHGEIKRITIKGRRYIVQPQLTLEIENKNSPVDNLPENSANNDTPLAPARPNPRCSETLPLATARHNKRILINYITQIWMIFDTFLLLHNTFITKPFITTTVQW